MLAAFAGVPLALLWAIGLALWTPVSGCHAAGAAVGLLLGAGLEVPTQLLIGLVAIGMALASLAWQRWEGATADPARAVLVGSIVAGLLVLVATRVSSREQRRWWIGFSSGLFQSSSGLFQSSSYLLAQLLGLIAVSLGVSPPLSPAWTSGMR